MKCNKEVIKIYTSSLLKSEFYPKLMAQKQALAARWNITKETIKKQDCWVKRAHLVCKIYIKAAKKKYWANI